MESIPADIDAATWAWLANELEADAAELADRAGSDRLWDLSTPPQSEQPISGPARTRSTRYFGFPGHPSIMTQTVRALLTICVVLATLVTGTMRASAAGGSQAPTIAVEFSESSGCGDGVRGTLTPRASRSGILPNNERLYGPWAGFFGRDFSQVVGSLMDIPNPFGTGTIRVHRRTQPALALAFDQARASEQFYYIYDAYSFAWRTIWGSNRLSQHIVANAIDINPPTNPYRADNTLITDMPPWFRQAFIDNGFCWGGQWENAKDTMHFSWMGPLHTAGYDVRFAPYSPLTAVAGWTTLAATLPVPAVVASGPWHFAADASHDGASDLYTVRAVGSQWRIEAAGAVMGFDRVGVRYDTGVGVKPGIVPAVVDTSGDGRPDLWLLDTTANPVTAVVVDGASDYEESHVVVTGLAWQPGTSIGFGYYDTDWYPDLFAVRTGATTTVEVFAAASDFATRVHIGPANLGDTTSRHVLIGDRDVDGFADLYAADPGSGEVKVALNRSGGFTETTATYATAVRPGASGSVLIADWDGDGRDDLLGLGPSALTVHLGGVADRPTSVLDDWFRPTDERPHFDAGPECYSEHCAQIGFVDAGSEWHLLEAPAWQVGDMSFYFGDPGDAPFMGDWDGDGVDTPGLYRRSDGFVYLRNANTQGNGDVSFYFGDPGDVPLIGDWDGDGDDTVSIYRPSTGRFYIINQLGKNGEGLGAADFTFLFGDPGDQPFAGDFDADGITEVALHRASTGRVYYRLSLSQGAADFDFLYGDPGDVMFAADWNGDGTDTLALYRPSEGSWYIKLTNSQGVADHSIHYHNHDGPTLPVVGVGHVVAEDD